MRGEGGVAVWDREVARRVGRDAIGPAVEAVAGARRRWEGDGAAVGLGQQVGLRIAEVLVEGDVVGVDRPIGVEGDVARWRVGARDLVQEGVVVGEPALEGVAGACWGWEGDGGAVDGVGVVADRIAVVLFIEDVVLFGGPLRIKSVGPVSWEVVVSFIYVGITTAVGLGIPAIKNVASEAEILRIQCGVCGFCLVSHGSSCRFVILVEGDSGFPLGEKRRVALLNEVKVCTICIRSPANTISFGIPAGEREADS